MLKLISSKNNITLKKSDSRLNLNDTMDAIFIINSMLVAIVKDPAYRSAKASMMLATLKQSSLQFENNDNVSEVEFFKLSDQFYSSISQLTEFGRVTKVILQEKVHIDRVLRLALTEWADYQIINSLYADFLSAMQSSHTDAALKVIFSLGRVLEGYALMARENYPDFFELEKSWITNKITGGI